MVVMKFGLYAAALTFMGVTWVSWSVGYTPELALVRGLLAFMAMTAVGYVGAIVVVTAPRVAQTAAAAPGGEQEDAAEDALSALDSSADDGAGGGGVTPIPFRARAEPTAAPTEFERQAA